MAELQTNEEKALTIRDKVATVREWVSTDGFQQQLKLALPEGGVTANRLTRIVMTEVQRTPKLAECSYQSMAGAVMACAQLGLEPGPMGFCYLIPRNNRQKNCMEANFQIGYKGLTALAWRSPKLAGIQCEVKKENDVFSYSLGIPPHLNHVPADHDRGEWTHVWAVISTISEGWILKVMNKDDVLAVRDQYSEAWKHQGARSAWGTNEEEMAQKTVLIRALKFAPISTELAYAINLDDRSASGIDQELAIDVTEPAGEIEVGEDYPGGDPAAHVDEEG